MSETLYIACDHGGFDQKEEIKAYLESKFHLEDLGTYSLESVHYPDFAKKLCTKVLETNGRGILLCGSGIGVSISANRFKGIRAAVCRTEWDAEMSRRHNNSNVICLGGRASNIDEIKKMVDIWLATEFEGGRHQTRVDLIDQK